MKLTKRRGFNFFRSYYDVYNELSDADKVAFMDALLDRQFLGEKPENLTGMAKFAYISQTNSIDSQIKGYNDRAKSLKTPQIGTSTTTPQGGCEPPPHGVENKVLTPPHGGNTPPPQQEQVQEKEQEQEQYLYSEKDFLIDWKTQREKFLKKPTNVSRLSPAERTSLREVSKDFKREEIKNGLEALFRQQVINFTSMHSRPQHYLDHIDKYQTAYEEKDTRLYGAVKQDSRL